MNKQMSNEQWIDIFAGVVFGRAMYAHNEKYHYTILERIAIMRTHEALTYGIILGMAQLNIDEVGSSMAEIREHTRVAWSRQ